MVKLEKIIKNEKPICEVNGELKHRYIKEGISYCFDSRKCYYQKKINSIKTCIYGSAK